MLGKKVDCVATSFLEAAAYFPPEKTVLCGNPIRPEYIKSDRTALRRSLAVTESDQVILIMGGSQGAGSINLAALDLMEACKKDSQIKIFLLTGKDLFEQIMAEAQKKRVG